MEQVKVFGEYTLAEQQEIYGLVVEGGEVNANYVAPGLKRAHLVGSMMVDKRIVCTASLKRPQKDYVEKIETLSGSGKLFNNDLLELGYIYILPNYRGKRLLYPLLDRMLECSQRIMATTRIDNVPMGKILLKYGFAKTGEPYKSQRSQTLLQAFIREKK